MNRELVPAGSGEMFDGIAHRYDLLNRIMSLGMDRGWRRRTVRALALQPGDRVLDLATGTADLAIAVARRWRGVDVVGVDPSTAMLAHGQAKVDRAGLAERIRLERGDAQALPFADGTFTAVTIAFGLRNIPDRARALAEMARVTRPGGRVAVLELGEPRRGLLAAPARFYVHHVVPRLGALLSGAAAYRHLQRSMAAFPPPDQVLAMLRAAGLEPARPRRFGFGACHLFLGHVGRWS
ncbi:MAG TPA: bifunctional demethylmenaquinone methyltransferase/2-methoxy-6-polyprenyl-1,4-benzoquinol methylase UbiE [Kofleriaceae bacterium]|jgi:demethylmenaquinone methyltransferase/2-methoxy-6-polyprenyl-1,4-benzoquinol methylase|nr:bifunctional demethylmenaquinone methyltransferase/2-methoxy-6-polyprenyl-1,4-benzoquinol methylase UbiE [Kofleriaceae bacterium]